MIIHGKSSEKIWKTFFVSSKNSLPFISEVKDSNLSLNSKPISFIILSKCVYFKLFESRK